MADLETAKGLVYVAMESGPDCTEGEVNDWYDNEHAPLRLTVPGFLTGSRYKAIDSKTPTWLTLYDISTPEDANSDEYKALRIKGSEREKDILSRLGGLSRRTYAHITSIMPPHATPPSFPGKFVFAVSLEVTEEGDTEFNKWYNEEHLPLLAKVPGILRGRRYKLVEYTHRGKIDSDKHVCKYLALYDFEHSHFMELPELKHAISTPWRLEVMKTVVERDLRIFELHKVFERPQ